MGRPSREDYPGAWHHVSNRGLAKRPVLDAGRDVARFLDLLGLVSAKGWLEVHAYALMTNHFHLLVRSPAGKLSKALWTVENEFVRSYNRCRGRDGPLFRSRFWSRVIASGNYWHSVRRYIDRNPVVARMAPRSVDYPRGSAWWYFRGGGPACLRKDVVRSTLGLGLPGPGGELRTYPVEGPLEGPAGLEEFVELRNRSRERGRDPLDELVGATDEWVAAWMARTERLADGRRLEWVLVSPESMEVSTRAWTNGDGTAIPVEAMLYLHCGLTLKEVAKRTGVCVVTVHRRVRRHGERLTTDSAYQARAACILKSALDSGFMGGSSGVVHSPPPMVRGERGHPSGSEGG